MLACQLVDRRSPRVRLVWLASSNTAVLGEQNTRRGMVLVDIQGAVEDGCRRRDYITSWMVDRRRCDQTSERRPRQVHAITRQSRGSDSANSNKKQTLGQRAKVTLV